MRSDSHNAAAGNKYGGRAHRAGLSIGEGNTGGVRGTPAGGGGPGHAASRYAYGGLYTAGGMRGMLGLVVRERRRRLSQLGSPEYTGWRSVCMLGVVVP